MGNMKNCFHRLYNNTLKFSLLAMIGGRKMENRNFIETVVHTALTKRELIELINKSFPDEEVGNNGQIAQLTTTIMSDGTEMQNICV